MKKNIFNENGRARIGLIHSSLKHMGLAILCILLGCSSSSVNLPQTNRDSTQDNKLSDRFQGHHYQFNDFRRKIALLSIRAGELSLMNIAHASNAEAEAVATSLRGEIQKINAEIDASKCSDEKISAYKADLNELGISLDKELAEIRQYNKAREEEEIKVSEWKTNNAEWLKQTTDNAEIEIVKIATRSFSENAGLFVLVSVSNTSSSVIMRPVNVQHWGFDEENPNHGGTYAIGTQLTDSFGNSYRLEHVYPEFYSSSPGIRPGDSRVFTLCFTEMPLPNASEIRMIMEAGAFGQSKKITFNIPGSVFFGAVAMHDLRIRR